MKRRDLVFYMEEDRRRGGKTVRFIQKLANKLMPDSNSFAKLSLDNDRLRDDGLKLALVILGIMVISCCQIEASNVETLGCDGKLLELCWKDTPWRCHGSKMLMDMANDVSLRGYYGGVVIAKMLDGFKGGRGDDIV
ncbi:hypothetical protein HPP92_013394 [Vanilla planifolia]|uniref:Uncharacterized protein n=1 Tax=Vanilla planifolia TaxID=51239 RepID=A0A835UZY6_VANPL|nr:hypothetical protein HPP92_013394 [Vanilla planifolia]